MAISDKKQPEIPEVVTFLRRKDYRFIKELGRGACGVTVQLYDETIRENFVCKKYSPFFEAISDPIFYAELFDRFIDEIKLLHLVNHPNIVRIFNYHIYPEKKTAFILMEMIEGFNVLEFIEKTPDQASSVFKQSIAAFQHLEANAILHRDIRPDNILVSASGVVKIIDFGFGKSVLKASDFNKSLSLNWWCDVPEDFESNVYDFATEVYFCGMIFKEAIMSFSLVDFQYGGIIDQMTNRNPQNRLSSFAQVQEKLSSIQVGVVRFTEDQKSAYRAFADSLMGVLSKIKFDCTFKAEPTKVIAELKSLYSKVMLEDYLPDNTQISRIFLTGAYYFRKSTFFTTIEVRDFIFLLENCSTEKQHIILNNLESRVQALPRYDDTDTDPDDEIPF